MTITGVVLLAFQVRHATVPEQIFYEWKIQQKLSSKEYTEKRYVSRRDFPSTILDDILISPYKKVITSTTGQNHSVFDIKIQNLILLKEDGPE